MMYRERGTASGLLGIAGLTSLVSDLAEKRMKEPSAIPRYPHIGFSVVVRDDLAAVTKRSPSRLGRRTGASHHSYRSGISKASFNIIMFINSKGGN